MRNLVNLFHEQSIRFNPRFADGFAKREVEVGVKYLSNILYTIQKSFPDGLSFEGIAVCSPDKAYAVYSDICRTDKKYTYDFARNDYFLTQINFNFKGESLSTYLFLPFTNEFGVMYVRDRPYYIHPVLADPLISVTPTGLFILLTQTKMTTGVRYHFFYKDGELHQTKIHETTVHNTLRKIQGKDSKMSKMRITCNGHYLFAKYGYKETFERFGAIVAAGFHDKINYENYPADKWHIFSSTTPLENGKLTQMTESGEYIPNEIRLAVKKDAEGGISADVESLVGVFFYILDFLPDIDHESDLDDKNWWIIKLGRIILGSDEDSRILMRKMEAHFTTTDTYIDPNAVVMLAGYDIFVSDLYEYLEWGIINFDRYRQEHGSNQSSLYNKYLIVNRYMFEKVITAMFNAIYELRQKKADKLTAKDVLSKLKMMVRVDLIMRNNSRCPNISSINASPESRLLRVGSGIIPQDNMRQTKSKRTVASLQNQRWVFDVSFIDAGGFAQMSKSEPVGQDTGNPCLNISLKGQIQQQGEFKDILEKTRKMISRV